MSVLPGHLQALLLPRAYPHPVHAVQLIETHVSWVLLTGEFAYKIKRPVRHSFVRVSGSTPAWQSVPRTHSGANTRPSWTPPSRVPRTARASVPWPRPRESVSVSPDDAEIETIIARIRASRA